MTVKILLARFVLAASLLFIASPAKAEAIQANQKAERGTLTNGLAYLIIPSSENPGRVRIGIHVFAGKAYEDSRSIEAAHLIEHILAGFYRDGRGSLKPLAEHPAISIAVKNSNAITDYYNTHYFYEIDSSDIGYGLDIIRNISSGFKFDENYFYAMNRSIAAESLLSERSEGHENLEKLASYWRDLGVAAVSTDEALRALTVDTIQRYYDRWYQPQNEIVYIVGDIDAKAAKKMIDSRFGGIRKGKTKNIRILNSLDFRYLYYPSHSDERSRAYIQIGVDARKKFPRSDGMISLIFDGVRQCLVRKMDGEDPRRQHRYFIFRTKEQYSFRNNSTGAEVAFSTDPADMALALQFFSQSLISCRSELLEFDAGKTYQDAVSKIAERASGIDNDFIKQYILTSRLFDQPTYRNYVAQHASPGSPEETSFRRDKMLNWILSPRNIRIAAYDPVARPSVLASERSVRSILNGRSDIGLLSEKNHQGGRPAPIRMSYPIGEQLSAAVGPRLGGDGRRWAVGVALSQDEPSVLTIRSDRGFLDLNPHLAGDAISMQGFLRSHRITPPSDKAGFSSARISIDANTSSVSFEIEREKSLYRGVDIASLKLHGDDLEEFLVNREGQRYEFLVRPVDDALSSASSYFAINGIPMGCSAQLTGSSGFGEFGDVVKALFGSSADLTLQLVSGDKILLSQRSPSRSENSSLPPSKIDKEMMDGLCEGPSSLASSSRIVFLSTDRNILVASNESQIASHVIRARIQHRLREQVSGVYAPMAALVTYGVLRIEVGFTSLPRDVASLTRETSDVVHQIAQDGPSIREVVLACASLKMQCDVMDMRLKVSKIFGGFLNGKESVIRYSPKREL